MGHALIDPKLHSHPKAFRAGIEALGLWVTCVSHCAMGWYTTAAPDGRLTQQIAGFVDDATVLFVQRGVPSDLPQRLVDAGLWERVEGGYRFVDLVKFKTTTHRGKRESATSFVDRTESFVYFVLNEETSMVKIGWTKCLESRLASLQTGSSSRLTVLATMPGGRRDESRLHKRFAHLRSRGEWFSHEGELAAFIDTLRTEKAHA